MNLFSCFTKEELLSFLSSPGASINEYGKNEIIHIQNEKCTATDIILDGKLSILKINEKGDVLTIGTFTNGDILGANLLFAKSNYYPMTVTSNTKSVLLRINKDLILDMGKRNMDFMVGFIEEISDKALILTEKIDSISFKTIRQKIIDYLKYEQSLQGSTSIKMSLTKKELSERFGIERTSLSRELNKMRKEGLLNFNSKTINIIRSDDL